jgi:hypothetical protein
MRLTGIVHSLGVVRRGPSVDLINVELVEALAAIPSMVENGIQKRPLKEKVIGNKKHRNLFISLEPLTVRNIHDRPRGKRIVEVTNPRGMRNFTGNFGMGIMRCQLTDMTRGRIIPRGEINPRSLKGPAAVSGIRGRGPLRLIVNRSSAAVAEVSSRAHDL